MTVKNELTSNHIILLGSDTLSWKRKSNVEVWPVSIEKLDNGKSLNISFDDKSEFKISAELLRVESPSADILGHGGPKIIVKNKKMY